MKHEKENVFSITQVERLGKKKVQFAIDDGDGDVEMGLASTNAQKVNDSDEAVDNHNDKASTAAAGAGEKKAVKEYRVCPETGELRLARIIRRKGEIDFAETPKEDRTVRKIRRELKRRYWREYGLLDKANGGGDGAGAAAASGDKTDAASGDKQKKNQLLSDAELLQLDLDQAFHFTDGECLLEKVDTSGNTAGLKQLPASLS